jgi:hypothetical protein
MMLLPNGERAVVAIEKLRDYCLNGEHPRGRHKARVFATALGFTAEDAPKLLEMLLAAAATQEAQVGENDEFGQRYILDIAVVGPTELVTVRSVWIIRPQDAVPHLVTCYVL